MQYPCFIHFGSYTKTNILLLNVHITWLYGFSCILFCVGQVGLHILDCYAIVVKLAIEEKGNFELIRASSKSEHVKFCKAQPPNIFVHTKQTLF